MKAYTLDTNIISAILKGNEKVNRIFISTLKGNNLVTINAISFYEIRRGLLKVASKRKAALFKKLFNPEDMLPLDYDAIEKSAKIYADLSKKGLIIEDADILIAGMAIINDMTLVTDNTAHFKRIEGIKIENWLK